MSEIYNKKSFLLPKSINSCSMYHAKIFEDETYIFRIHDCITGIRLKGDLKNQKETVETYNKIQSLIDGLTDFRKFIFENYIKNYER